MDSPHVNNGKQLNLETPAGVVHDLLDRHGKTSTLFWRFVAALAVLSVLGVIGFVLRILDGVSDKSIWGYYVATFAFILTTAQAAPMATPVPSTPPPTEVPVTATATAAPTATPTATPTPSPVPPTPTATPTPTPTTRPTATATLTPLPAPTATPAQLPPTATPAPAATPTPTPTATPTATATVGPDGFTVYFIDVGQGDATLIIAASGESLLIDGGRSKTRIRERLSSLGITDLDAVLATHADSDHISGLVEVFDLFQIERFYWNGQVHDTLAFQNLMTAAQTEGSVITVSTRGDTIPLGNLSLQVLHPSTLSGDSNVDSIVVLLSCGTVAILLTGDAEIPSEEGMLVAGILLDIDVLKVGHHGSRTSTSDEFLGVIAPEVGVISAGLNSQYGHPNQEVVDRLTEAGVELWHTDISELDDTVALVSDCGVFALEQPGR